MSGLLSGKVIVITGGAGLLGRKFIKAVVREGGTGIIADIDRTVGEEVKNQLTKETQSDKIDFYTLDITSQESVRELIDSVSRQYGRIDAVVNNAYPRNKNYGKKFEDVSYEDFCENVDLHLGGYFLVSQQFAEFFKKQDFGQVLSIASIYGVIAPRFEVYSDTSMTMPVEYSVIKSGIIHLTKYMAKYYKGTNLRFNSLAPGGILNNQPPSFVESYHTYALSKGMLDGEDITGTLIFLLSDLSRYINGQTIVVDDGWTL